VLLLIGRSLIMRPGNRRASRLHDRRGCFLGVVSGLLCCIFIITSAISVFSATTFGMLFI
jgi:hypothetical protein